MNKLIFLTLVMFLLVPSAFAILGQFYNGPATGTYEIVSIQDVYQTFAGQDGTLELVAVFLSEHAGTPTKNTTMSIWNVDGSSLPTTKLADFTNFTPSNTSGSPGAWLNASGSVVLSDGITYAIVLRSDNPSGNNAGWRSDGTSPSYTGGSKGKCNGNMGSCSVDTGWDNLFQTYYNETIILPAVPPQAVLIKQLSLPNISTSSSDFTTIAIARINLTKISDIDVIVSLQGKREGGTGTDNYLWRIIIDDDISGNTTRSMALDERSSVAFSHDIEDASIGLHNITLQHLSTDGTLFSEGISMFINLHIIENETLANHIADDFDFSLASTSYTIISDGIMDVTEDSIVTVMLTSTVQSTDENTLEFLIEFNGQNTSSFRRRMENSADIGSMNYIWQYDSVTAGSIPWKIWGKNTEIVTTEIKGHIDIDQMTNDNVPITISHFTNQTTLIEVADTFTKVANVTLATLRNNSVYASASFTINIDNQASIAKNVTYFLKVDNIESPHTSRTLSDVDDIGNIFIQHIFNETTNGTHDVSLFVASELGGARVLVVTNVSMYVMEVIDFGSVFVDSQPPSIILNDPSLNIDNTINNTIPFDISFSVSDDSANDILCIFSNTTETFDSDTFTQSVTNIFTLAEGEISLNQNFPDLRITCFDNTEMNNSAFISLNITLDNILPIITTISPSDEKIFNRITISSISIKTTCTDNPVFRLNITIENATDRIASFESRSPVDNVITIDESLSISNLGIGNYTITNTCADPHTKTIIGNYYIKKNSSNYGITYNRLFTIRYLNDSGIGIKSFGTSKEADRYKFWYRSGEKETPEKRVFTFEIISRKPVYYLPDSIYRGHFVTGNNWIDFEIDDADAAYLITENEKGNFEISITTSRTDLEFNSVGDLNIVTETTTFEIISIDQITDLFIVTECRTDTGSAILLGLFILISLFLITLGIVFNIGFIGFFGSLALLFTSFRIVPCISALATILIFLSIVLMFFFIFRGTFSENLKGLN